VPLQEGIHPLLITTLFLNYGYGYALARQILEESFYVGEDTSEYARVVMFHSLVN